MTDRKKNILIFGACIVVLAAAGIGYFYYTFISSAVPRNAEIYISRDTDYEGLLDSLQSGDDKLNSITRLKTTARVLGFNTAPRPGHYTLKEGMDYVEVIRMFQRGLQTPVNVTFNNIRTLPQLAGRISEQLEPDSLSFAVTLLSDTAAAHYGFNRETFMAMFIPNTYEMYWTTSPAGFTDRMKKEYDRFWNDSRKEKLSATGLTEVEAVILASVVYEETKMADEMPAVAGVYINRLRSGMKLQADPTVKYAVGDFTLRRILYAHLDIDSPYNTYMYAGLPPGPICMPSVQAIDAVLNYQKHRYLYFCARPDFSGYHNFATTLAQHNRNRQEWINAINQAGIR